MRKMIRNTDFQIGRGSVACEGSIQMLSTGRGWNPGTTAWPRRKRPGAVDSGAEWGNLGGVQGPLRVESMGQRRRVRRLRRVGAGFRGAHNGPGNEGAEWGRFRTSTIGRRRCSVISYQCPEDAKWMSGLHSELAVQCQLL